MIIPIEQLVVVGGKIAMEVIKEGERVLVPVITALVKSAAEHASSVLVEVGGVVLELRGAELVHVLMRKGSTPAKPLSITLPRGTSLTTYLSKGFTIAVRADFEVKVIPSEPSNKPSKKAS